MSERIEVVYETSSIRLETFYDDKDTKLFRCRIIGIDGDSEWPIFTSTTGYEDEGSAMALLIDLHEELIDDLEVKLNKQHDRNDELHDSLDEEKRIHLETRKLVRTLEATIREYESRVGYIERKRQANLDYAANCQGWAIAGWCVAAILLGFCLFI